MGKYLSEFQSACVTPLTDEYGGVLLNDCARKRGNGGPGPVLWDDQIGRMVREALREAFVQHGEQCEEYERLVQVRLIKCDDRVDCETVLVRVAVDWVSVEVFHSGEPLGARLAQTRASPRLTDEDVGYAVIRAIDNLKAGFRE